MIMPIQLLKLSAVNKEGSESVLIHCLFYIAMRSEEAAGGRFWRYRQSQEKECRNGFLEKKERKERGKKIIYVRISN